MIEAGCRSASSATDQSVRPVLASTTMAEKAGDAEGRRPTARTWRGVMRNMSVMREVAIMAVVMGFRGRAGKNEG